MDVHFSYRGLHFVWTAAKAADNKIKHGIEFERACQVFFDDLSSYADASVEEEERAAVIGLDESGRLLLVVHVAKERDRQIRLISARAADVHERREYEDG